VVPLTSIKVIVPDSATAGLIFVPVIFKSTPDGLKTQKSFLSGFPGISCPG
jgi:hypothetical protein